MKSIEQRLLAAKIEYHWWLVGKIKKHKKHNCIHCEHTLCVAEKKHRYKAEKALFEYEIYTGLRDSHGVWKNCA